MPEPPFIAPARSRKSRFAPWYLKNRLRDSFETPAKRRQIRFETEAAAGYGRILVNSHFSRESVLRAYGLDATVCYLGIDCARLESADRHRPRGDFVMGLGAVVPEKNVEFIVRAVHEIPERRPKLIWAGNAANEWYRQYVLNLARELGVEFDLRERVPNNELNGLLATAAALLYAPRLEPFGYAPLEANAGGTPVIVVAEGGVRETVQNNVNGLVVEANPKAMAEAIQKLRGDPALASRLGEAGCEFVRTHWPLDAAIGRLEANLVEVAKAGHP
jgi:glycosyltransferase involved in cell wall biosynthesis